MEVIEGFDRIGVFGFLVDLFFVKKEARVSDSFFPHPFFFLLKTWESRRLPFITASHLLLHHKPLFYLHFVKR